GAWLARASDRRCAWSSSYGLLCRIKMAETTILGFGLHKYGNCPTPTVGLVGVGVTRRSVLYAAPKRGSGFRGRAPAGEKGQRRITGISVTFGPLSELCPPRIRASGAGHLASRFHDAPQA